MRRLPYFMLGALTLSLIGGWGGAAAGTQQTRRDLSPYLTMSVQGGAAPAASLTHSAGNMFAANSLAQAAFANPAFQRVWERTDKPVASGQVQRSWYWGPTANSEGLQEDYAEGAGGKRLVQYFDKSRMEINNVGADPNSPFYVTNGLLAVELISGKMQVGNAAYTDRYPADIPLASDADDANAPTYLSFQGVTNTPLGDHPAESKVGKAAISTIARNGTVGEDATKGSYPRANYVYYEQATKHNVPQAIWDFLNESGPVYNSATGKNADARLSEPWFYATGLPISEPYWALVKIAGQPQDVLIQAFERRIVTYAPNGVPGFKVQMGNIGAHYYDWRYKDAGRPATQPTPVSQPTTTAPSPTATTVVAPATPTTAPQPQDPNSDCSGIPAPRNMIVTPDCGPGGTIFRFEGRGFEPGENVGIYISLPDQAVFDAEFQATAEPDGRVTGIGFRTINDPEIFTPGIWGITMEGVTTHNKAIGYFKILSPGPTPTPPPAGTPLACDTSGSVNGTATPPSARPGTTILFRATGFSPSEEISFWFTLPNGEVLGTVEPVPPGFVNPDGSIGPLPFPIDEDIVRIGTGRWGLTFKGASTEHIAVIYFCVQP
jgi:hypothetical protein